MASLRVLAFDHEGRPVQFDTWLDDMQLYLLSNSKDSFSLFDLVSGAATAPPATADSSTRSQWLTRDSAAHLAIRNHLPLAECAHFAQHRTAQALYNAVVARYSSLATAALGRLLLPYLFPDLSAFTTVEDLVSHLCASDARYRAAVPAEFLDRNPQPMDHFFSLDPTSLTVDLLEQHLLAAETIAVAVGAARGTPRQPFFEGCSPSPLAPSYASAAAAAHVSVPEDGGAASASAKRRSSKGKGGRGSRGGSGGGGGGSRGSGGGSSGGGGGGGTRGGSGGSGGGGGGSGGSGGGDGGWTGGGIAAAALDASESGTLPGTAPAEALHTFILDSGASCYFFCDSTTLTPLPALVPVRLAEPLGDRSWPVPPLSSRVQQFRPAHCQAFTSPRSLRSCVCRSARAHGRGITWLRQVAASCSCRLQSHQTLLWHHRLGHPSLPRLRGMHSRLLVPGLPRSLPPLPPSPAPPCLPCVEGRQRAAPHSSFPPTIAPLQTLHMDVWGPARVSGQSRERYFLLVVNDYTRYTTVFPLRSKGQVVDVLIPWIRTVHLQLRERFDQDLPVISLHSDRGGELFSNLLRDFCRGEGILQSFTLPNSPQQNGIAERRIGLVMEVARTSMIHAADPHFLWLFVVQYVAHQLNLWPRVSFSETSPTLLLPPHLAPCPPVSGVSQVDPLPGPAPVQGAGSEGAETRGAEPGGFGNGGAEPEGVEPGGAPSEGAAYGGAEPQGAAFTGGSCGASPRLSPQQLREWFVRRARLWSGATGAGGAGGPGVEGAGAAGVGVGGTGAVDLCVGGAGDTVRPRLYFVPLLQKVLGTPSSTGLTPPLQCPPPDQLQPPLQPASPLHAPSPYTEQSGGLTERREPVSRPVSPVCTARRPPCSRPPLVPGTHAMALRPSSVPLCVSLPAPPDSSLPEVPNPESDRARAVSPAVSRLLATAVIDPSFESAAASALVVELLDFAAACRLDYATALVAESASASPPSVGGECALGMDVLEDRQEDFECLAAAVPRFASMLLAPEVDPDAPNIPTTRSYAEAITGTYVDEVPPPGANIVDGMWIFRVKRPPGSPPAFKALYVARGTQWSLRRPVYGLHQAPREWHDTLRTTLAALGFAPSTADPSLFLRTDTSLQPFYVLVYVLQRFGFQFSSPQPTPLSTSHSLSAPPSDESVEPSGPYPELVGCLMYLMTCTRPNLAYPLSLLACYVAPVVLTGHADASWVDDSATQRSSQSYTFSLGSGSVSWRSTCSSLVLSSSCEPEIYAGAMAAQELRWLTYLLTDLGEQPRLPPVMYVDNKAIIALCQEH
ncbi:unnamed protein product [Closterium sp. NIES-53]